MNALSNSRGGVGRRAAWALATAMLTALSPAVSGAAELPPADHFTRAPNLEQVFVSPSGKRMAVRVLGQNGLHVLAVMDLDPLRAPRVVGGFSDGSVTRAWWVNDDRLVYEAFERGVEIQKDGAGTFAVNHDGSDQRTLIAWRPAIETTHTQIASKVLPYGWFFHSTAGDGSNDVFVYRRVRDGLGDVKQITLSRLDTSTGKLSTLSHGMPEGTLSWLLDGDNRPRVLTAYKAGRQSVYWRPAKQDDRWTQVAEFDPLGSEGAFDPWHVDADGSLWVLSTAGTGTEAIHRFDPETKRLDPQPLVAVKGFDLDSRAEIDRRSKQLLGVHFVADRPMSFWLDAGMDRIQRGIDAALPGRSNRLLCGDCRASRFIVVRSRSDRQPGEYLLFDREKQSLEMIGAARPWLDEAAQGRMSLHRVAARDGFSVPVYVTHPAGAAPDKALPTVVLVHGGPWSRGASLQWQAWPQFLASRGYRVLQPEFRGSTGYGEAHFRAGFRQWGHAMQDDLADAVKWAVGQGLVDPGKVCIMGASYGGYASLMGPIAHPGVYRCAVSFAGVTDIDLMYGISWSDISEAAKLYSMPVLVGDREKDAQRLAAASPLRRVVEIKVPVLLAHGLLDRRVPVDHAARFAAQARRAGVTIDYVTYPDEAHGFLNAENEADFLRRVERFLEKSLRSPD